MVDFFSVMYIADVCHGSSTIVQMHETTRHVSHDGRVIPRQMVGPRYVKITDRVFDAISVVNL